MSTEADPRYRWTTMFFVVVMLVVFVVMVVLGIFLRLAQGNEFPIQPQTFYAWMTMHALGMVGATFSAGLAMIWFIVSRYARPSVGVMHFVLVLIVLGAVGLLAATLIGHFGPGWYSLYPLPFVNPGWPSWSIGIAIFSLMLLGVGWLLCQLDILLALARKYGLGGMLGWNPLAGAPEAELPAAVLISAVCVLAGALSTLVGATTLMIYMFKWLAPAATFDALMLKNMMFMFGHTVVNVAMYCGIAAVYEILPGYTKRPWKVNKVVVVSWNCTLVLVLFAYFHHLYMDFAQPSSLQYIGQIASYVSAVPATAVTVFGVLAQVNRAGLRWSFTPLAFFLGVVGWVIGGFAAVVDSTIAVNQIFHNTLWVPGHFHTYFLVGFMFILFGFVHHFVSSTAERMAGAGLLAMVVGGYGFVGMFYLGGVHSVPRRFASYQGLTFGSLAEIGGSLALYGAAFAVLFLAGALWFFGSLGLRRGAITSP